MEEYRLWGRIIRQHRIAQQETVDIQDGDIEGALVELCRRFDISRPLQLPKHDRDFQKFGHTFYAPEHFTEPVTFQKLEIELLVPDGKKRGNPGPRTPLVDA